MKTKQAGFTLVEIAIVLVIIGLLLGGILKGQEMITQAKIKNVVNDFNGITAAVNSYQDRYKALPGDDLNAPTRWGANGIAGNGDGQIGATADTYNLAPTISTPKENNVFWLDLRLAGFVGGTTAAARWLPVRRWRRFSWTAGFRAVLVKHLPVLVPAEDQPA